MGKNAALCCLLNSKVSVKCNLSIHQHLEEKTTDDLNDFWQNRLLTWHWIDDWISI